MAEDLDSGQSAGTSASPNADGSQGKGDSSGSFDAAKLQSTLESALKRMEEIDKAYRTFQSGKDRGANESKKASEEVAELKRKIAEIEKLKKSGLDEDGAIEEHTFREDIRSVKEQLSRLVPVQTESAGNGEGSAGEAAKVFSKYGVDPNDPAASGILSLRGKDLELEVTKIALAKKSQSPPDSSTASALQGSPAPKAGVESLTKEYQNKVLAARGNKPLIKALRAEYESKGVPVGSVVFTIK